MPTQQQLNKEIRKTKYAWAKKFEVEHELNVLLQQTYFQVKEQIDTTPTEHLKSSYLEMAEKLKKKFTCAICLEEIKDLQQNKSDITITKCGHIFCKKCLNEWLKDNDKCPTCRTKLVYK